jgi:uncharacterized lipoprotein YajG
MRKLVSTFLTLLLLTGCALKQDPINSPLNQSSVLQDRVPKTRVMYLSNKDIVAPAIVATLQDLGYQVDYSSTDLHLITGQRRVKDVEKVTVTFRLIDKDFVQIRANFSHFESDPTTEMEKYQFFFSKLSKSLFLMANGVL